MKPIGIYHRIDLQALDLVALLRAKGADIWAVKLELARLARDLGISPRTAEKRTRPASVAWMVQDSPLVGRAAELFLKASRAEQTALHVAVLVGAYPFFYHTLEQVGTAQRLGAVIRQATVRDRLIRRYGHLPNVQQGARKVLQTLVSWDLLRKTAENGVYTSYDPMLVSRETAEVLVASVLDAGDRDAIPAMTVGTLPALFAFELPAWSWLEGRLLNRYSEGSNDPYLELAGH